MSDPLNTVDQLRAISIDGHERSYWVHVPPTVDLAAPTPVVLAFHGGASSGRALARSSGLSEKADAAGFVVVYPNGTGDRDQLFTWNAGTCCGYAHAQQVDDVAFVMALLDELAATMHVDPARVFATGLSNGAMLAYRLASEHAERFAAIAPVAGPMAAATCSPSLPASVIHFHGTLDEFTPLAGGVGKRSVTKTNHYSVEHSIQAWVGANACPSTPVIQQLPTAIDDGMRIERRTYGPGRDDAEVVLYLIDGGGHTWPGRPSNTFIFGRSTQNISANNLMWEFFFRHARR